MLRRAGDGSPKKGQALQTWRIESDRGGSVLPRAVAGLIVFLTVLAVGLVIQGRTTAELAEQVSLAAEAGKQRLRVERIAYLALVLSTSGEEPARELARVQLKDAVEELQSVAEVLEYHPAHRDLPGVEYAEVELDADAVARLDTLGVEEAVSAYAQRASSLAATPSDELTTSSADLQYVIDNEPAVLAAVDAVVVEITESAAARRERAVVLGQLATVAELVVVAVTGLLVFLPLAQKSRVAAKRFESLFRQAPDGLAVVSNDGLITAINDTMESMFGYSAAELVGRPVETLMPERFRGKHRDLFASYVTKPDRRQMGSGLELWARKKDGTEFPVDIMLAPLETEDGLQALAAIRDVTQRKLDKDALLAYAAKLERSNRELEGFASLAAHDLQEPLRKVQAFGDRLRAEAQGQLTEKGQDYLDRMMNASARMRALIDDLLTYSRVSTRARPFERLDLGEVAAKGVDNCEQLIEETGGTVTIGDLPEISADRIQMGQLLQNLISNALKFHRPGVPPIVEIEGELIGGSGPLDPMQCRLTVKDNGIGFDEKYLDKIFTMFERLHGRLEYPGTGVGLAICRRIVDRHGGEITATSSPGEGATFIVTLPVDHESENPDTH